MGAGDGADFRIPIDGGPKKTPTTYVCEGVTMVDDEARIYEPQLENVNWNAGFSKFPSIGLFWLSVMTS